MLLRSSRLGYKGVWKGLFAHVITIGILQLLEGPLQAPSPSSAGDTRVSEESAWVNSVDRPEQTWTKSACWSVLKKVLKERLYI